MIITEHSPELDAEHGTAASACRRTLTAVQRRIQSAVPGLDAQILPYIDHPQLRLAGDGRAWLLSSLRRDPLAGPGGRYVLPPSAVADLRRLAAARVEFHTMVVAHEIGLDGWAPELVAQLRGGPRHCPPDLARALVGPVPPDPRSARLARCMNRVVTAVARPAAALARETSRMLDPVIFGLIAADGRLEPGWPALWVVCTSWEW